jgi:histidinol-phosphatase (PHP family)
MYVADQHTHSICSPDGEADMTLLVKWAIQNGVEELTITDHCDLLTMEGTIVTTFDWQPLRAQFARAKEAAEGKLLLNFGIEIGGASDFPDESSRILQENLDFVLGSVHNLSVKAGCTDFYDLNYQNNPALCQSALEDYFSSMERLVAWGEFDSLAHVPYLLRYLRDRDGMDVTLSPWEDRIRALLRTLVEKGKALELNTCRGKSVADYEDLFRWYRQEGGELVTIGSDAHNPRDIGTGIQAAQVLLSSLGYRYQAVYRGRTPVMKPLN